MKLWIVLPAFNEEKALPPLISRLIEELEEEKKTFCIMVVNDGSSDQTAQVVETIAKERKDIGIQLINHPVNQGLAETLKTGLIAALKQAADRDIILTMDADNTHPAALSLRMMRLIKEGNDVVIASRYQFGSYVRGVPWDRQLLSYGASWLFRVLFPVRGVKDYTSGYRAYRVGCLRELYSKFGSQFIMERGFSCMVDILLGLRKMDLIFTEVPLILRYDLKPGRTKMQVLRTIKDTLLLLFRRRFLGRR